jgi:hypothetical protein
LSLFYQKMEENKEEIKNPNENAKLGPLNNNRDK